MLARLSLLVLRGLAMGSGYFVFMIKAVGPTGTMQFWKGSSEAIYVMKYVAGLTSVY